jgi:hypothetical protein
MEKWRHLIGTSQERTRPENCEYMKTNSALESLGIMEILVYA